MNFDLDRHERRVNIATAIGVGVAVMFLVALAYGEEHRSKAVLDAFQRAQPCPSTGLPRGSCPGYVKDHIRPLACGGEDSVGNLQWQTIEDGKAKDRWERGTNGNCDIWPHRP